MEECEYAKITVWIQFILNRWKDYFIDKSDLYDDGMHILSKIFKVLVYKEENECIEEMIRCWVFYSLDSLEDCLGIIVGRVQKLEGKCEKERRRENEKEKEGIRYGICEDALGDLLEKKPDLVLSQDIIM